MARKKTRSKRKTRRFGDLSTDLARRGACPAARAAVRAMPEGIRKDYAADRVEELCSIGTGAARLDGYGFGGRLTEKAIREASYRAKLIDRDQDMVMHQVFRRQSGKDNEDLLRMLRQRRRKQNLNLNGLAGGPSGQYYMVQTPTTFFVSRQRQKAIDFAREQSRHVPADTRPSSVQVNIVAGQSTKRGFVIKGFPPTGPIARFKQGVEVDAYDY